MRYVYVVETFTQSGKFLGLKVFASKKSAKKFSIFKGLSGYETSTRKERVLK